MTKLLALFALACFSVASVLIFLATSDTHGTYQGEPYDNLVIPMTDYAPKEHIDMKRDYPKVTRSTPRPTLAPKKKVVKVEIKPKPKVVKVKKVEKRVERKKVHKKVERHYRAPGGVAACIRRYESGGNYRATSPNGKYTGAYQFSDATWHNVTGRNDSASDAPPATQDAAFYKLWDGGNGANQWSTAHKCGY